MDELPALATVLPHARAVDFGHVLVLIDYRTGDVKGLLPTAAERFREAARTGRPGQLPGPLASQLLTSGFLAPTSDCRPWPVTRGTTATASWGSVEHPAGTARPRHIPLLDVLRATGALSAVAAVKAVGHRRTTMLRVIRTVHRATSTRRRPATPEQAAAAVLAVRAAGWNSPGRSACLEESAAAVLLMASRCLGVTWCHGIAADPVRLHAWVQTEDGTPIAEPLSTSAFTPVLTLGAHHHQS
ncbi:lasso peptide biosynthesis B2 protein [Streptomyces halstedii]|uniref:lasso peptide biosynthesis B2 protein n=1 Tax=Streptomyces halstedii TaxID=1944 RepID=UPI0033A0C894